MLSLLLSSSDSPAASAGFLDLFPFPIPRDTIFEPLITGQYSELKHFLSLRWWLQRILTAYEEEPGHVIIEILCIIIIFFLLFRKPYDPKSKERERLTPAEEKELLESWTPEPLAPPVPVYFQQKSQRIPIVTESAGAYLSVDGKKMLNFGSANFLGLANTKEVKDAARATIERYGVGSCGPRGFYGSFDVHLQVEQSIRDFLRAPACILYSDAIACLASVIPAFSKRGDLIIADESVNFGVQQGLILSRSEVIFFKHNDMTDLERVLKEVDRKHRKQGKKLSRRFIVVEGVYQSQGDVSPLPELIRLKNQYKYRLIVDDSYGFGVLGESGRGSLEHWNVTMDDVDIVCGSLDTSLATVGGFCVSSDQIVDHQRLSGAGYCFSAASPPYCSSAGIVNVGILEKHPELVQNLHLKAKAMRQSLAGIPGLRVEGNEMSSPIIHLRLTALAAPDNNAAFESSMLEYQWIANRLRDDHDILLLVPDYIPAENSIPNPSLKLFVNVLHENKELDRAAKAIRQVMTEYNKKGKSTAK